MRAIKALAAGALLAVAGRPAAAATTILFVGNSFTHGDPAGGAPPTVQDYRPGTVTDLNGTGLGGVPALFKQFTAELGLDYQVSLETVPGAGLDHHYTARLRLIDRRWDKVVLQGYSTLDADAPGNPAKLVAYAGLLSRALRYRNPAVGIYLAATWSRADLTYRARSPWLGRPIDAMARAVQAGCEQAAAAAPGVAAVMAVGAAWTRAMADGFADPDPYDGIAPGQVDLWAPDGYHASPYGYYLEALVILGAVTGRDPRLLGPDEAAARHFGFTPGQAAALQDVAYRTLATQAAPRR